MVLPAKGRWLPTNCKLIDMGSHVLLSGSHVLLSGSQLQTCSYFDEAESIQTFHCNDEVVEVVHMTSAGLRNNLELHRIRL
jgi:hypothetical protein